MSALERLQTLTAPLKRRAPGRVRRAARYLRARLVDRQTPRPPWPPDYVTLDRARRRRPRWPAPGVNLVGYFHAPTGVGQAARGTWMALRAQGVPVTALALTMYAEPTGGEPLPHTLYGTNLLHVNCDATPLAYARLGTRFFAGRRNVGFWFWEMASFPPHWHDRFPLFDEVWVASRFTQQTLAPVTDKPVVRVRPVVPELPGAARTRADFGIAPDRFVFLYAFDLLSIVERKNPFGFIEAYRKAFGATSRDTQLVLKLNHQPEALERTVELGIALGWLPRLEAAVEEVNGLLIDQTLDRGAMCDLMRVCDSFVSLHRCEGFGLSLAEAMSLGKPCIATGYSGNLDFMNEANSYMVNYRLVELEQDQGPYRAGWRWAEPETDHAAALMRRVYLERQEAEARGAQAARDIRENYNCQAGGAEMTRRLANL